MRDIAFYIPILLLGGLSLAAGAVLAQQQPPAPDLAATAAELNVPEVDLMACLGPRPEPGQRPERPDPSTVAACLTEAGHQVSENAIETALATAARPPRN